MTVEEKREYERNYYKNHKGSRKANAKRWALSHPEKTRFYSKRSRCEKNYGVTVEEYDRLLLAQNNLCGCCGQPFGVGDYRPCLDHDHDTGKVREFIHNRCNIGLARFYENPILLRAAALYLNKHGK